MNSDPSAHRAGGGPVLALLERIDALLANTAAALGALLVLATVALVTYSVAMRYLFGTPQTWTDELVGYFLVYVVMLGVAAAMRRGEHINVDLVTARLPVAAQRVVECAGLVVVIAVCIALAVSGYQMVRFSLDVGLVSDGYVEAPMWIPQAAVLGGYLRLALSATNRLLRIACSLPVTTPGGIDDQG